jgi:hypothetical protein
MMLAPKTCEKRDDALSTDRAANALQMLASAPELAALVETWLSIPEQARTVILGQAASIQIGVREECFPIAGSICKIAPGLLTL